MPTAAQADWACEVALCISNPAGPMAVSECRPPIQRLYRHLARGGSFPLCRSADGYVNFTRYGVEFQEECPSGTRTVYLNHDDRGGALRGTRHCETFQPVENRFPRYGDNGENFEWRVIDGRRVYGQVILTQAPIRQQPRFLEYVVEGDARRLWW